MSPKKFYLVGEGKPDDALDIDISSASGLDSLKFLIAGEFVITAPESMLVGGSLPLRRLADFGRHCVSVRRRPTRLHARN